MKKIKKYGRTLIASALSLALIAGVTGGFPGMKHIIPKSLRIKQAHAATTVKTVAELSVGDKVTFKNMAGTLATTWTYCGCPDYHTGYYFECDASIGSYTSEEAITALAGQESCLPATVKTILDMLSEGPRFYNLWAQLWGISTKDAYRRNGASITSDEYYDVYSSNGGSHYLGILPASSAYRRSLGENVTWEYQFDGFDGLTYPNRQALTASAICYETNNDNYYQADSYGVFRNGSGGFGKITSGTRYPVYPAIRFKRSVTDDLCFGLTANGTYTQVERGQLTFNANGGMGSQKQVTYYVGTGDSVTLPAATTLSAPDGKFFRGWSSDSNGSELLSSLTPTGTTTIVYAVWDQIVTYETRNGKKYLTRLNPYYTGGFEIDKDTDCIAAGAFDGCVLSKPLVIPYNVSEIEAGAFLNIKATAENPAILTIKNPDCVLSQTSFKTGATRLRGLVGGTADKLAQETEGLECEGITVIPSGFFDGETVRVFNCPDGVTDIGLATDEKGVFEGHEELKKLNLGAVRVIGANAFKGCTGLTGALTLPETVTTIGDGAFSGCTGITGTLTIPEGVVTIGAGAFADCTGLTGTLTIPESVTTIGTGAFEHVGVSEIIIKNKALDPQAVAPTSADGQPITCKHEEKKPEPTPTPIEDQGSSEIPPSASPQQSEGNTESSTDGGSSSGSYSSSSGYSSGSGSGSSSGSGNGKPVGSEDAPETTAVPIATPLPIPTEAAPTAAPVASAEPVSDPSAVTVNDPEEEIPAPVVIEKIVTDISDISSPKKPGRVKVRSISRIGGTLRVKCRRIKNAGYQLQFTTDKGKWKRSTVKKSKKQAIKLKHLSPNKTYYIRVRAFRGVGESRVYGKWTKRIQV